MTARTTECIVGLLSFVLAAGTVHLTSDGRGIAAVWPANAVLLAALLDRRPGTGTGVYVAGFLANVAANMVTRGASAGLPLYGLCNLVEIGLAARWLRPSLGEDGLLSAPAVVGRFIVVCGLVAPALSGVGGAAIAWLLPETGREQAEAIAARLREALRRAPLTLDDGTLLPLAMSCGVALHRPAMRFEDFAHGADMALYAAKRAGRRDASAA